MNAAEIRADLVNELRAAAEGYQSLGVRNMQIAGMCRDLAAQHRAQAEQIEANAEMLKAEKLKLDFAETHNADGLADESTAEPAVFKLNAAASSSAATLTEVKHQTPNTKPQVEMERAA